MDALNSIGPRKERLRDNAAQLSDMAFHFYTNQRPVIARDLHKRALEGFLSFGFFMPHIQYDGDKIFAAFSALLAGNELETFRQFRNIETAPLRREVAEELAHCALIEKGNPALSLSLMIKAYNESNNAHVERIGHKIAKLRNFTCG